VDVDKPEVLKVSRVDRVAIVTLNRPDSLNSLNPPLMLGLVEALTKLADDDDVRCVVLTGEGRGFCAGGDVRAINKAAEDRLKDAPVAAAGDANRRSATTEHRARWLRRCAEASRLLHEMPKPTIAMINGACAGAGLSLAAACDFRYAAASAIFRPSFLANGLSGDYGGSWLWSRILGPSKARQLYFFDKRRDANDALAFGLVDEVFEDDALGAEVMGRASQLAGLPGAGGVYAKANLNAALTETISASLDRESLGMMLSRNVLVEARRLERLGSATSPKSGASGTDQPVGTAGGGE
jgi:2-(1,2-epoxy-1,2-dihydrophenyl)acetyl-CoA isomerase